MTLKSAHLLKLEIYNNFFAQNGIFFQVILSVLIVSMLRFVTAINENLSYLIGVYLLLLVVKSIFITNNYLSYKHKFGIIEYLLVCYESFEITVASFCFITITLIFAQLGALAALYLMYDFQFEGLLTTILTLLPMILQISSLSLLMSFIALYLENSLNLILFIILPLVTPGLILTNLSFTTYINANTFFLINVGTSLVLATVSLFLCNIILKSIYNTGD